MSASAGLPPEIVEQSLSQSALILPLEEALRAIELRTGAGRRVECWEGWVRLSDGGRTRSLAHGGSFSLPTDPAASAARAATGMREAQERWNRSPEYDNARLYFELTFSRG